MAHNDVSEPIRTYEQAFAYLEKGIDYEKTRAWQYNGQWLKVERVVRLLEAMGNPHRRYNVIHVAGTKGKGSTAGAAAHLLTCSGHKTGLVTSPHLVTARERVRIDGRLIPETDFAAIVESMRPYIDERRRAEEAGTHRAPTYFEMLTALSFEYFAREKVDWAVVEVGLGGRLDSTNVVSPACCVVTAIGLDHTDKLGATPDLIAGEKAGIFKPGVPVLIGRQRYPEALEVLRSRADERRCPRTEVGIDLRITNKVALSAPADRAEARVGWRFSLETPSHTWHNLYTPLLGEHQLDNLAAAIGSTELALARAGEEFDPEAVPRAIDGFQVNGRLEVVQRRPAVVLDVAHTVESVQALLDALDAHFPGRPVHMVFGCSRDKNLEGMMAILGGRCRTLIATEAKLPRALAAEEVARAAREGSAAGQVETVGDSVAAMDRAMQIAQPADVVCAAGSFFTTGEIRAAWRARFPHLPE